MNEYEYEWAVVVSMFLDATGDAHRASEWSSKVKKKFFRCNGALKVFESITGCLRRSENCDYSNVTANMHESVVEDFGRALDTATVYSLESVIEQQNKVVRERNAKEKATAVLEGKIPEKKETKVHAPVSRFHEAFFRVLGCNGDHVYVFDKMTGQIQSYSCKTLSSKAMLAIAPLHYWEGVHKASGGEDKISWENVISGFIYEAKKMDLYDYLRERRLGVWNDGENIVVNLGKKRIMCNGQEIDFESQHFNNIYVNSRGIDVDLKGFTPVQESRRYWDLVNSLDWDNPAHGMVLCGWVVCSIISGGLTWRPHAHIIAERGSGKSWILGNIVTPVIDGFSVVVQGEATTEAGIRQKLEGNALSVVFDESEADKKESKVKMQSILQLARSSSSGGTIVKGGQDQKVKEYHMRSCFMFSSTKNNTTDPADESRITVIELKSSKRTDPKKRSEKFDSLRNTVYSLITPEFCSSMKGRAIKLANTIIRNADTIASAITPMMKSRRNADQVGTLMAGAYSLLSDELITEEVAIKWAEDLNALELIENSQEAEPDEVRLLNYIMQSIVKDQDGKEAAIGEIVQDVYTNQDSSWLKAKCLGRYGIAVKDGALRIADSNKNLQSILADTAWSPKWKNVLKLADGAKHSGNNSHTFIGSGTRARYTELPMSLVFDEVREEQQEEMF